MEKYKYYNAKTQYVHDFYQFISEIFHQNNHDSIVIWTLFLKLFHFQITVV